MTAQEILKDFLELKFGFYDTIHPIDLKEEEIIKCMETYANQFKPKPDEHEVTQDNTLVFNVDGSNGSVSTDLL